MPLTVVDEISQVLFDRLSSLVAGSQQTQVVEVVRPSRLGNYTPRDLQIVITQADAERVFELDCPGNPPAICFNQVFNVRCHLMPSEEDRTNIDQLVNQFVADVIKVICADHDWYLFDNFAFDAQIGTAENIETGEGMDGVVVPVSVLYRVSENDPYAVRA